MRRSADRVKSPAVWTWLLAGVLLTALEIGAIAVYVARGAVDHLLLVIVVVLLVCHFLLRRYSDARSRGARSRPAGPPAGGSERGQRPDRRERARPPP